MDGSRYAPDAERSDATRAALTVDRDALGLMRYASQVGHLLEWWLQGAAATMDPLSAFRIGKRHERFRLAARLAEGRSSQQVQMTLEALRSELSRYSIPAELHAELERARAESERLRAVSPPPPTLVCRALDIEAAEQARPAARKARGSLRLKAWLALLLSVAAIAWWVSSDPAAAKHLSGLIGSR
jgi:hypothetical protein